nr:extracellular solute-binding protein [Angustibacter aerolatus]
MRFFASKNLAGDISDVWQGTSGFSDALKAASTGDDGKQYFVPFTNYPWAMYYRPSLWKKNGYEVPKTLDDLTALGAQMKKDGLTPIAFGDKDGWPAMGTFDQPEPAHQRLPVPRRPDGRQGGLEQPAGQEGVRHLAGSAAPAPERLARPHLAGGGPVAAEEGVGHLRARHVRRPAVPGGRARRPGLLHLPGDRPVDRHRRDRGADRRVHDVEAAEERGGRQGAAEVPRDPGRRERLGEGGPDGHRGEQRGRHQRLLGAAEEGRRVRGQRQGDRAVHGPRRPARLRQQRDDPGDPAVHQEPERRRRADEQHREAEEVDLRERQPT